MQKIRREILPQDLAMWVYLAALSVLIIAFRYNLPKWKSYLLFNLFVGYWFMGSAGFS